MFPTPVADRERQQNHGAERQDFQHRQQPQDPRAQPQPRHAEKRQEPDQAGRDPALLARGARKEKDGVLSSPRGQRRRHSRIQDEEALPAIQKRDPLSPGLPKVDVETAGLRKARGELAERERTRQDEGAAKEPETERQGRRRERADQLRRRQEDPYADRMADHERCRGPEPERAGVFSGRHIGHPWSNSQGDCSNAGIRNAGKYTSTGLTRPRRSSALPLGSGIRR